MTRPRLVALAVTVLLAGCGGPGDGPATAGSPPASTPPRSAGPAVSPSSGPAASPGALVRVIVELDDAAFTDGVLAAFPDATNVRRTQYSPLIILELPESRLPALRRQPHVTRVTIDTADPPSG